MLVLGIITIGITEVASTTGQETNDMHHLARLRAMMLKVNNNSERTRVHVNRSKLRGLESIFIRSSPKTKQNKARRARNRRRFHRYRSHFE